jgi:hypothetical protein
VLPIHNILLLLGKIDIGLLRGVIEVHVHQSVTLVRDQHPIDVLKDQTDRRRPLPDLLLVVEVQLGVYGVDSLVVATSDEYSLIVNLIRLSLLNLEAVVEL